MKKVYTCRLSMTVVRWGDKAEDVPAIEEAQLTIACKQVPPWVQDVIQVKYEDFSKMSSMFWQQPASLFGYNMKNWVIKDWSYTVQLCAHFWLHLELQKLQWLLRKESLAFLLIRCNSPGREPICQFKYPLKVQGTVIFPSHHASSSLSGMCAKVFPPRRMPHIKRVIPGLALSSLPSPGVSALTFIPVSHFSVPWIKMLWKHPPSSSYMLTWNEKFSWLDVDEEQGNPVGEF